MVSATATANITVEELLKSGSLPSLPAVAVEVVRMCRDSNVDVGDLAKTLSMDPTLASKLLKLANSPKFCRRQPLTSIEKACVILGLKTLKIMSLSFSLAQATSQTVDASTFDFSGYWFHSICKATIGRDFARLVKQPCQDEAFFCGLVGRIGQLTMATGIPHEYNEVIELSNGMPEPEQESEILGFQHHEVGGELLKSWGLPALLADAVRDWSNPPQDSESLQLCRIVQISDKLATVITAHAKGEAYTAAHELGLEHFGLSGDEIDEFVASSKEDIESLADVLDVKISPADDFQALIDEARQQTIDLALDASLEVDDLKARETELVTQAEQLQRDAQLDALTGIPNRGEFDKKIDQLLSARKQGNNSGSLAILMIDVDHFKSFNDTYGHLAGDEVLRNVAAWMEDVLRPSDFIARYGGEEFSIILPNVSMENLQTVAERVRKSIESKTVEFEGTALQVTASIGAAVANRIYKDLTAHDFIKAADTCLYQSKAAGRNQVQYCSIEEPVSR